MFPKHLLEIVIFFVKISRRSISYLCLDSRQTCSETPSPHQKRAGGRIWALALYFALGSSKQSLFFHF